LAYLSLYRKWRPQTFDEIAGQSHVTQTLKNAISLNRVSHAYLFCGPRGTGKTSTARILAKSLNCEMGPTPTPCNRCESCISINDGTSIDVLELDAASNRGVEETRELLKRIPYSSTQGGKKVYIIDEVHMLTTESFNTLLKTLEEPPNHVIFVLATTEPHRVPQTILSRCQRFDFRRIPISDIEQRLDKVADSESIDIEAAALSLISHHAQGSLRDALGILDQLASYSKQKITSADVISLLGMTDSELLLRFTDMLIESDLASGLLFIDELTEKGLDIRQFIQDLLSHLRNLFLIKSIPNTRLSGVLDEQREKYLEQASRINPQLLMLFINILNDLYSQSKWATDVRLLLEISLFKMVKADHGTSIDSVLNRVERLESIASDLLARLNGTKHLSSQEPARPVTSVPPSLKTTKLASEKDVKHDKASRVKAEKVADEQDITVTKKITSTAAANEIDLGTIERIWPQVLKVLKDKKRSRYAFFEAAKLSRIEDGKLVLSLKESHRAFVEDTENTKLLQSALKAISGLNLAVVFEFSEETASKENARTIAITDVPDVKKDLLPADDYIKLVQDTFGAKIVEEISINEIRYQEDT